jgi:Na+/proline symporter
MRRDRQLTREQCRGLSWFSLLWAVAFLLTALGYAIAAEPASGELVSAGTAVFGFFGFFFLLVSVLCWRMSRESKREAR